MELEEWSGFRDRIAAVARMAAEEYGLSAALHPHAGGFVDFEPEIERMLAEIDPAILHLCLDTGHSTYAGFDPVAFARSHWDRISYLHLKATSRQVRRQAIAERTDFYEACANGIFCNLSEGELDLPSLRELLIEMEFDGWCTVEQDCDPSRGGSPAADAAANRRHLQEIGFD